MYNNKKLHLMSLALYFLKKAGVPSLALVAFLSLTSCSSSRTYYDIDGVYGAKKIYAEDTHSNGSYYQEYFKEKGEDADQYITDIENYSSYSVQNNYGAWGDDSSDSATNIFYDSGWYSPWGWSYGFGWGYGSYWGWGYPYSGWYGGWGYPYYYSNLYASKSYYRRPLNRSVSPVNARNNQFRSTSFRNNERIAPRRTLSQPSNQSRSTDRSDQRFSNSRRDTNWNTNRGNISRDTPRSINTSRSTLGSGRSLNTASPSPRMSSGSSRGFGGGGAPMRSSGRR